MCKAYLDTNILLDVASDLRPGHQAAVALLDDPHLSLAISAGSIEPGYEDGTKRAAAEAWGATWIVSRDAAQHAFSQSPTARCTAQELRQ